MNVFLKYFIQTNLIPYRFLVGFASFILASVLILPTHISIFFFNNFNYDPYISFAFLFHSFFSIYFLNFPNKLGSTILESGFGLIIWSNAFVFSVLSHEHQLPCNIAASMTLIIIQWWIFVRQLLLFVAEEKNGS